MNIITVFNYPDDAKYNTMFKIWLFQALLSKSKTPGIDKIKILTEGMADGLVAFVDNMKCEDIVIEYRTRKKLENVPHRWLHNVGFKLYNLCLETEPFVFVDADAIIMTDMNDIVSASQDKPFICVDHQTIPKHTDKFNFRFMNTGFFVVSDTTFLDFDVIYKCKQVFQCPGTDQYLMNNYCRYLGYDYRHPLVHYGWNSCGGYKIVQDECIMSSGIEEKHRVHVLHYWDVFKPWITPCPIYRGLEQKYTILDKVLPRVVYTDFYKMFDLFDYCFVGGKDIYTTNAEIYPSLRVINLKGVTTLHTEQRDDYTYIDYL